MNARHDRMAKENQTLNEDLRKEKSQSNGRGVAQEDSAVGLMIRRLN